MGYLLDLCDCRLSPRQTDGQTDTFLIFIVCCHSIFVTPYFRFNQRHHLKLPSPKIQWNWDHVLIALFTKITESQT